MWLDHCLKLRRSKGVCFAKFLQGSNIIQGQGLHLILR